LLRNSTAEYIDSLRPRLLGFILVMLLKVVRPWCWLPQPFKGDRTKDWYLVTILTILLPWTLFLWQRKAKKLAREYSNLEIISAVNNNSDARNIIASLGFSFIIEPILQYMSIKYDKLASCRFWHGAGDRNLGKLAMMQKIFTESEIKSAILITDSKDDLPLLKVVGQPYLALWSLAKYTDPFKDLWLDRLMQKLKA